MSDSLQPHEMQHTRLPYPSLSPSLLRFMSIESAMPSIYLLLCCPLLFLPSIFPNIRVFSNELALHSRWPKYWSISFGISPSNEYSALIYFRIDWFDLFAVQGTLKRLLQHHSSKASILWHLALFMVQLSYPYMTTRKTKTLTIWTFVSKVMSLLFNMLSRHICTLCNVELLVNQWGWGKQHSMTGPWCIQFQWLAALGGNKLDQ